MTNLDGKIVWITGASSGIGEALAKTFATEGGAHHFCPAPCHAPYRLLLICFPLILWFSLSKLQISACWKQRSRRHGTGRGV